jgi:hypothetical protein
MGIIAFLVYVFLIACLTIYIHYEKQKSYQKGFSDGVEHYSSMVEEVLQQTNRFNREAEEAGIDLTAHVESIKPFNKAEKEEENGSALDSRK